MIPIMVKKAFDIVPEIEDYKIIATNSVSFDIINSMK